MSLTSKSVSSLSSYRILYLFIYFENGALYVLFGKLRYLQKYIFFSMKVIFKKECMLDFFIQLYKKLIDIIVGSTTVINSVLKLFVKDIFGRPYSNRLLLSSHFIFPHLNLLKIKNLLPSKHRKNLFGKKISRIL